MNKSLIDFITKVSLCGILVLIFVVLFNILREPYTLQANGFKSDAEVKAAYQKTQNVGKKLDKDFMDDYVENLETAETNVPVNTKSKYTIPLPREYSVVHYESTRTSDPSLKKN